MWIKGKYAGLVEIEFGFEEPKTELLQHVKDNIPEFKRVLGERFESELIKSIKINEENERLTVKTQSVELSITERETP